MRALVVGVALGVIACGAGVEHAPPRRKPAGWPCLADELPTLRADLAERTCHEDGTCAARCEHGDGDACFHEAQAREGTRSEGAQGYFARACRLGLSIGCVNWAAHVWVTSETPHTEGCARRLFAAACDVRDPFGCGMLGRWLAVAARTDDERQEARAHFDRACDDLGGVTCRMYARHLEEDQLGPWSPALVTALLLRACETGDDDACGAATAGETFH